MALTFISPLSRQHPCTQVFDDIACCVGFVCELPFEDRHEHSHGQVFIKHEQKLQAKTTAGIADDIHGASFVDGAVSGDPMDQNGHGTFVAGQQPPMCVDHFGRTSLPRGVTVTVKQCAFQSRPYNSCMSTCIEPIVVYAFMLPHNVDLLRHSGH